MNTASISEKFAGQYVIYCRKSTDDTVNQQNSLDYQRKRNMDYVTAEGLPFARDLNIPGFCKNGIAEEAHSAFKEEDEFVLLANNTTQYRILRPKFAALIQLLKEKKIRGVVFLCWHRASRNEHDDMIIKKLEKLGADIRFTEMKYDKGSSGDFHKDADGMFARHYSRVISDGVRKANIKLREEGRCIYPAPIGYLDNGSISKPLDPERAPIVKRIFEQYATGDWSIRELARWAQKEGLTKKPHRRMRTKEEISDNMELESVPKIARPVDHKTIEYVLRNKFYLGKFKAEPGQGRYGGRWQDSKSHQPLIDTATFNAVQRLLSQHNTSLHYAEKPFYAYRGIIRCECGRVYSPYTKKGHLYYFAKCHDYCENMVQNLSVEEIEKQIQTVMDGIHLTEAEITAIEEHAKDDLDAISERRDKKLGDLQTRQQHLIKNLEYLTEERVTLLRTGAMDGDSIRDEQERLGAQLDAVQAEMRAYGESAKEMLRYVLTFSELAKNASLYYKFALDNERREIVMQVFSELVFVDGHLKTYVGRDGFDALLKRPQNENSGAQERT